jgi:hypothetical protein
MCADSYHPIGRWQPAVIQGRRRCIGSGCE